MFKKSVSILICIVMVALFTGCPDKNEGKDSKIIKIGAVFPLSGDAATYGQSSKKALELLVDETNKNTGLLGKKVEIVYEDDENKPQNSANVLQKMIKSEKIIAVIGTTSSDGCIAMANIANQAKIPMITATATNPRVTQTGDYIFRAAFIDPFQGTVLAKFATEDLKAKKAAVLYDTGNDYSKGLADYFKASFEKAGGKVVSFEYYNTDDQDFSSQLTKIKAKNPEVFVLPDYYNVVGLIAKQARAQGITATFLGGDGWSSPDLYKIGGSAINGAYFSDHTSLQNNSQEAIKFKNEYKAKYGKEPDSHGVLAYDAGTILFNAVKKAKSTDGSKIKDAMKQTDLNAVSGSIKFDENRNPTKSAVILKVENDKQIFVKKINP